MILSAARSFPHRAKLLTMRCGGCLRCSDCRFCKNGAKTLRRNSVSHGPRFAPHTAAHNSQSGVSHSSGFSHNFFITAKTPSQENCGTQIYSPLSGSAVFPLSPRRYGVTQTAVRRRGIRPPAFFPFSGPAGKHAAEPNTGADLLPPSYTGKRYPDCFGAIRFAPFYKIP